MSEKEKNTPKQKRSFETRLKILQIGGMLIMEKGFHNVTTDDIAKAAGLSTGIVYHYFRDKQDILIQALQMIADHLMTTVKTFFHEAEKGQDDIDFDMFLDNIMEYILSIHQEQWQVHEELEALYRTDPMVAEVMDGFWKEGYEMFAKICLMKGANKEHISDNIRLALNYFESYCHTYMRPITDDLDQEYMRIKTKQIIRDLIFGKEVDNLPEQS